jgi:hypothetical protein
MTPNEQARLLKELRKMHPYSRAVRLDELAAVHGQGFANALRDQLAEEQARREGASR